MPASAGHDGALPGRLGLFGVVVDHRRAAVKAPLGPRRGRPQEPRERCPRRAPAARARLKVKSEAFVTVKTQGELSQREMHTWRKLSYLADHRRMTPASAGRPTLSRFTSS